MGHFLSDLGKSLKSICVAHLWCHTSSVKLKNLQEGSMNKAGPKGFVEQFAALHEENEGCSQKSHSIAHASEWLQNSMEAPCADPSH
jgi:hypothetical protein